MPAADGKIRKINAANTGGVFRIVQFIPLPKAEPFKRGVANCHPPFSIWNKEPTTKGWGQIVPTL